VEFEFSIGSVEIPELNISVKDLHVSGSVSPEYLERWAEALPQLWQMLEKISEEIHQAIG